MRLIVSHRKEVNLSIQSRLYEMRVYRSWTDFKKINEKFNKESDTELSHAVVNLPKIKLEAALYYVTPR